MLRIDLRSGLGLRLRFWLQDCNTKSLKIEILLKQKMYIGCNCTYFNKYCLVHFSHWSYVGWLHRSLHNRQIWSKVQRNDVFSSICWWLDHGCWGKRIATFLSWKICCWLWFGSNIFDSSSKCQATVFDVLLRVIIIIMCQS